MDGFCAGVVGLHADTTETNTSEAEVVRCMRRVSQAKGVG
jgi:hypothetical protein